MVIDDGSFTLLALSSFWDQKFWHFQLPQCHPNWANELSGYKERNCQLLTYKEVVWIWEIVCVVMTTIHKFPFTALSEQKHGVCHPPWGETLDAFTALMGRRIELKWSPSMFFFLLWGCSISKVLWCWLSRLQGGARKWEIKACLWAMFLQVWQATMTWWMTS